MEKEHCPNTHLAFSGRTVLSYDHMNEMGSTILSEISETQKHSRPHLSMISKTNSIAGKDASCQGLGGSDVPGYQQQWRVVVASYFKA